MRFLTASLLFAALLLSPLAAPAQTPTFAKTMPKRISVQVTFVTVNTDDLDALGINFDLRSLPALPDTYLRCASGSLISQRYQTLMRTAQIGTHAFKLTAITVNDNTSAIFTVGAQFPGYAAPVTADQQHSSFPQLTDTLQIHGKITLIPQIILGTLVKLDMLSPLGSNQRMTLYCVPSGQQIVINTAVVQAQPIAGRVQIEGVSRHSKVSHTTELLVFVTPTIVNADAANDGTISIMP